MLRLRHYGLEAQGLEAGRQCGYGSVCRDGRGWNGHQSGLTWQSYGDVNPSVHGDWTIEALYDLLGKRYSGLNWGSWL